jgi:uracil-DNA glycosylase family 4
MVIGQSPGKREDYEGHPWVGPAGAMMTDALSQAGIRRYYATNAAKCSPEVNGLEIDMAHVRACADYLDEEIAQVKPAFILALGNPAVQRLIGRGKVSEIAGKEVWSARAEAWVVPALHPAAILRNQGRKPAWLADILRFGLLVRGELQPPPSEPAVPVDLISTESGLRGLSRLLVTEPFFTYDWEANVQPWYSKAFRSYCVGFSFDGTRSFVVPTQHPDVDDPRWWPLVQTWLRNVWRRTASDQTVARGAWNDVYDALVWYRHTGVLAGCHHDAMMSAQLLDENAPKSLKWNGRARLGWPDWDIDARKMHPLRKLAPYNGWDAAATFLLWWQDLERFKEEESLYTYFRQIDMPKLWFTQRVVAAGIHVDRSRVARNLLAARDRRDRADAVLDQLSAGSIKNPQSADQVAHWLYDDRKLHEKYPGKIKKGKKHLSTDEETLNRLAQFGFPEVKRLLDCRRPRKEISTYYRPFAATTRSSVDGRYHAEVRLTRVETGRKASGFHTIPRPEESLERGELPIRPVFTARPGYVLCSADYRQLEARLAAWRAAGGPERVEDVAPGTMLWDFLHGTDVYRRFASHPLVLNKPPESLTKNERQVMGKVPVLAKLYKISPQGMQEYAWKFYEIDWTLAQATRICAAFDQLYPEFPAWHQLEEAKLRRRGYAVSVLGRVRRLPGALFGQHDEIRAGINMPIQSLASDITQIAGWLISEVIRTKHLPYLLVGDIHDSILGESPAALVFQLSQIIRAGMLRSPRWLESLGLRIVPGLIDVEVSVGPWGEGKEIKFGRDGKPLTTLAVAA